MFKKTETKITNEDNLLASHGDEKGFVILFAMIISTIIILIAAGIFSIAKKEIILGSTASESQVALYAADTGIECTLYHEYVGDLSSSEISCLGENIQKLSFDETQAEVSDYRYRFSFLNSDLISAGATPSPACGFVSVERNDVRFVEVPGSEDQLFAGTNIISRGYNVCLNGEPDTNNPILVERRLEAWYPNDQVI